MTKGFYFVTHFFTCTIQATTVNIRGPFINEDKYKR